MKDDSYFISPNEFRLNSIKIGPFSTTSLDFDIKICDFIYRNLDFEETESSIVKEEINGKSYFHYLIEMKDKISINSDIKINIKGNGIKFYCWVNLWYSTLNLLKAHLENIKNTKNEPKNENQHNEINDMSFGNSRINENLNKTEINMKHKHLEDSSLISHNSHNNLSENRIFLKKLEKVILDESKGVSRYSIVEKLSHNTDLNSLFKSLNKTLKKEKNPIFNKNDMTIKLKAAELDKFHQMKKMHPNFSLNINFSLVE